MSNFRVDGIVARRDKQPYVRFLLEGKPVAQLDMAQARNVAMDILQMCSRAEADAMIYKFFDKSEYPAGAAAALMMEFRKFRAGLDAAPIETSSTNPDTGEAI
jgi:hypothetical protein